LLDALDFYHEHVLDQEIGKVFSEYAPLVADGERGFLNDMKSTK